MKITEERWKIVPNTDEIYEVSNTGYIRNRKTGIIRKPYVLPNGYAVFHYHYNKRRIKMYVHRVVAEAFCPHPEGFDVVNHLDNNKLNNRADNLEWTTQLANTHYGMLQRRCHLNAIPVIGRKDGAEYRFSSIHIANKWTGCDDRSIARCCEGIYKSSKGYIWSYAEVI